MIRINLLATERRQAKAAPKGLVLAQKMTIIGSLILVLTALGLGWRYWALGQMAAGIERMHAQPDQRSRNSRQCGALSFSSAARSSTHSFLCCSGVSAPRSIWKRR